MKRIILDNNEYELVKEYKNSFNEEDVREKYTDYFEPYDYIFVDYAYDKLRLKGFYEDNSKESNDINKISKLDDYIKNYCAYNCGYYLLKKIKK